jgi:hypothetical protein
VTAQPHFLGALEAAAIAAQREELSFRESIAAEIARRERDRQFAFRRLNLAKSMAAVALTADTEELAIAGQAAALARELGWHETTEPRQKALVAWTPVAKAVWQEVRPATDGSAAAADQSKPAVSEALATFETWYAQEFGSSYLALLDHELPEIPVVEF